MKTLTTKAILKEANIPGLGLLSVKTKSGNYFYFEMQVGDTGVYFEEYVMVHLLNDLDMAGWLHHARELEKRVSKALEKCEKG